MNTPNRSGSAWSAQEEDRLIGLFLDGVDGAEIARVLERSELAIRARLGLLGVLHELSGSDARAIANGKKTISWERGRGSSFVYAIVNLRGQVYIGYSARPHHRISQHNNDLGAVATRRRGPWRPFAILAFAKDDGARAAEVHYRRNPDELVARHKSSLTKILRDPDIRGLEFL